MNKKKRLLFVPADVIKNEVSRSFYFAKYLADHYDLYFLSRFDPQNAYFESRRVSKWYTLQCFFKSIFTGFSTTPHERWNYKILHVPFMSHMVIYRILGMVAALKIARWFNGMILRKVRTDIKPDYIFYADGFDLYPALDNSVCICDIQDDFDKGNFRDNNYNRNYLKTNLKKSRLNFVVSRNAAKNLGELYGCTFSYLPNGVDSKALYSINNNKVDEIRSQLKISGKYIVSYIGADAWYDIKLVKAVSNLIFQIDSSFHFLIIGNLPAVQAENITMVGPVSKEKSYLYYALSDAGILFKDSIGSKFLYNSVPLKIIQYGILNKKFLSPPIGWLEEETFSNVTLVNEFTAEEIVQALIKTKSNQNVVAEPAWEKYDWRVIGEGLMRQMEHIR